MLFAYVCVYSNVCVSVGAWATADKNACQSEWASECTSGAGSGRRAKESRVGDRRKHTERERGLFAVAYSAGASDSPGKGRCILPSSHWGFELASDWLQSDRGFPRLWSTALSSNVTRDFVVKRERRTGRRERDTCSHFLCTQPAWQMALAEWSLTLTQRPVLAPLTEVTYVSSSPQLLA